MSDNLIAGQVLPWRPEQFLALFYAKQANVRRKLSGKLSFAFAMHTVPIAFFIACSWLNEVDVEKVLCSR